MSDQHPTDSATGESPDEQAVRRLLAAARVGDQMPLDVEARLTEAIDSLSTPKKRRWGVLLPVAAAVLVVIGGVGIFETLTPRHRESSTISASTARDSEAQPSAPAPHKQRQFKSVPQDSGAATEQMYDASSAAGLPVVRPAHFVQDSEAVLAQPAGVNELGAATDATGSAAAKPECAPDVVESGGRTAVVSFRRATARVVLSSDRVLSLYSCDGQQLRQRALE